MSDQCRLEPGTYEHYKHHRYSVIGLCQSGALARAEAGELVRAQVAHYSESPRSRFIVWEAPRGSEIPYLFWRLDNVGPRRLPLLRGDFVFYRALYTKPGDTTPRLAIRPLAGKDGFTTNVVILGKPVERFRRIRYLKPRPSSGPLRMPPIVHQADTVHPDLCSICGEPMATPLPAS